MSEEPDQADFKSVSDETTERLKKCLLRPFVQQAGEKPLQVLSKFFDSKDVARNLKKKVSAALNRFADWTEEKENFTLNILNASSEDIATFLASVGNSSTRESHRGGLRRAYELFLEHGLLSNNPVSKLMPGPKNDSTLPDIVHRAGPEVVEAVTAWIGKRHPMWLGGSSKHVGTLHALRGLAAWAEKKGISNLKDVSAADGNEYIASLSQDTGYQHASFLRALFAHLVKEGVVAANPFPYAVDDPVKQDQTIEHILNFARASGDGYEAALRKFLNAKKKGNAFSNHARILNQFAIWLTDVEGVHSFSQIRTEHFIGFRDFGMLGYKKKSRRSLFPDLTQFFRYLHEEGLLAENPAAAFVKGRRIQIDYKKGTIIGKIAGSLTRRRKKPAVQKGQDFSKLTIGNLSYNEKYMLALFVRHIEKFKKNPRAPFNSSQPFAAQLVPAARQAKLGYTCWDVCATLGVVEMKETKDGRQSGWFTESFATRYANEGELFRAGLYKFLAEHEQNMRSRFAKLYVNAPKLKVA